MTAQTVLVVWVVRTVLVAWADTTCQPIAAVHTCLHDTTAVENHVAAVAVEFAAHNRTAQPENRNFHFPKNLG